ncbi:MAG: helix-turn-helix transcriptional regulator [Pyrinomonadaceae bacterium]|nr:helix-turn-helix transcriptional regulator [Pyrinomonadaceae bacterium]MBA3568740.1 helix-turn-helix transcriptional regulator [Pyrinomonadaceae bacterium]MBA3570697.1 helix-turn-helix transcriptional regulator [Pyrinomonadaceae bacterium]MDQ3173434.1 helix-turn-helix transcriptional regulator [Acidobacteriota bacterium]
MIEIRVDQLLEAHGRTFYWLAKETGISHTTLWRLKKGKALGINFETLEKMCKVLRCQPGDLLTFVNETQSRKNRSTKKQEIVTVGRLSAGLAHRSKRAI